jgi:uncharacterized membrane protein YfcA
LQTLKLLVPSAALGIFIASLTFTYFSEDLLKLIIGVMGFLFAGHYFLFKSKNLIPKKKSSIKGTICSTISGFTSFLCARGRHPFECLFIAFKNEKRSLCWNEGNILYLR